MKVEIGILLEIKKKMNNIIMFMFLREIKMIMRYRILGK